MRIFFKKISITVAFILAFSCLMSVISVAAEPAADSILATAVYGTPESIDGTLDKGWDKAEVYENERTGASSASETDISAKWRVMYDNAYLYFFISVEDSTLGDEDFEFEAFGNYYLKNSVHMMFDMGYERAAEYDENDFYFDVSCRSYIASHNDKCEAIKYAKRAVVLTDTGYNIEFRLDLDVYEGFKAEKGTCFGFELWANDCLAPINGRLYWKSWSDNGDSAWRDPSIMGTIQLGEIPAGVTPTVKDELPDEELYPGISNEDAEKLLSGNELKSLGAVYNASTNMLTPNGGGNKDISVIADGIRGKTDADQYDTFQAINNDGFDPWFGIEFDGKSYIVDSVVFWEGGMWGDGGWFGAVPAVQLLLDGKWYSYDQAVTPEYPDNTADKQSPAFEPYIFALSKPVLCQGIRVIGAPNAFGSNVSCSEIEVWGYESGSDIAHDVLDGKTPVETTTVPTETEPQNTEPQNTTTADTSSPDSSSADTTLKNDTASERITDSETNDDEEDGDSRTWIIIAAVTAVVAAAVIFIIIKNKKSKASH